MSGRDDDERTDDEGRAANASGQGGEPPLRGIAGWFFAPAAAERLAALRILIGTWGLVYIALRSVEFFKVASLGKQHFEPVGITRLLDAPLPVGVAMGTLVVSLVLLVLFVLGVGYRVVGPLAALGVLWSTTYRTSWGMIFHTDNLLVLHMFALAFAPAAHAFALAKRPAQPARAGYGWALKLMIALTAATYVLAGIAKLRLGGLGWLDGEVLRNHIAVDNLRKAVLGDWLAPLATVFLEHPGAFTIFSVMSLALELGAPIALLGGKPARLWAVGAWGFHLGVVLLMNIWFLYPLTGVAFAALLPVERPVGRIVSFLRSILRT
jgi:hypothetical protein